MAVSSDPASPSSPSAAAAVTGKDRLLAVLLSGGMFLLFLCLRPFVAGPLNDDFSYARTAEALARTGHLVYNGWGSPLLLPQAAIGALWIKLFGFSYLALEWFGLLVASLTTGVLYLFSRACGLNRFGALLATTIATLNPMYLGNAPSFMTDIPSLLMMVLSLWALMGALERDASGRVTGVAGKRLALATLLALLAGTNRQIIWIAFAGALITLFALVPTRQARPLLLIALAATLAGAGAGTLWFARQPYNIGADVSMGVAMVLTLPNLAMMFIYRFLNMLGMLLLPVLFLAFVGLLRQKRPIRWLLFVALALFCLLPVFYPLGTRNLELLRDRYSLTAYGQYFTHTGVLVGGVNGFAQRPAVLGPGVIGALVIGGAVGMTLGGYLLIVWCEMLSEARRAQGGKYTVAQVAATAAGATAIAQVLSSLLWYGQMNVFDRYYLLLLPGLLILHLRQAQELLPAPQNTAALHAVRAVPVVLVGILALWSMASAGEYFSYGRARMELYHWLTDTQKVPRTAIDGGFELSADTQVLEQGYINNSLLKIPVGAYKPLEKPNYVVYEPEKFPALDAYYILSTLTEPDLATMQPEPVRRITYSSPLPPFTRPMFVYRLWRTGETAPDAPLPTPDVSR